eukprot:1458528-Alexandrium_andersonii.AAC.1
MRVGAESSGRPPDRSPAEAMLRRSDSNILTARSTLSGTVVAIKWPGLQLHKGGTAREPPEGL